MAWQQTGLRKRSIAIGPTEVVLVSEVAGRAAEDRRDEGEYAAMRRAVVGSRHHFLLGYMLLSEPAAGCSPAPI